MCEMKYTLDGIDSRLEIAEEKINELDTIVVETVHTEAEKKKNFFEMNRAAVSCRTNSNSLMYT